MHDQWSVYNYQLHINDITLLHMYNYNKCCSCCTYMRRLMAGHFHHEGLHHQLHNLIYPLTSFFHCYMKCSKYTSREMFAAVA